MFRIEAMADAIQHYEGWTPVSRSYKNRNPGNLEGSPLQLSKDDRGYSVFVDYLTGYKALLDDLTAKVTGKSAHKLTTDSTLQDLFEIYAPRLDHNNPSKYCVFVCDWMTAAVGFKFKPDTKLQTIMYGLVPTGVGINEE